VFSSLFLLLGALGLANPLLKKDWGDPWDGVRGAAARMHSSNNLKQFGVAMQNYGSANGDRLPPAVTYANDGKPLLSWRVMLLPYLEQDALYRAFRLDEPWDSPHNIQLLER